MKKILIVLFVITAFIFVSCSPMVTPTPTAISMTETLIPPPQMVISNTPISTWEMPVIPHSINSKTLTVLPQESGDILINPGKGWVLYYPWKDRPEALWDVVSVCYSRLEWNWIEPTEGSFDWSSIDNSIKICEDHGKKFAFGIMAASSASPGKFVTPEWVFTAGAKSGEEYTGSDNGNLLTSPVWNDPIYLQKMQDLINALAARYDGDPNIAYIDARNCGNWGEWHSFGCSELSNNDRATLIDQWSIFKKTQIIVNTNFDLTEYQARYGTDTYGFGIRTDSSEFRGNAVTYAYDKAPAVSEWGGS